MITNIFFIIIGLAVMYLILSQIKKKKFFEKEGFFWVIGSIAVFILALFPNLIKILSYIVGIEYAPSLLFLVAIIFCLYLLFRQTEQVSLLKEQVKELGQKIVVLEKILNENEEEK